MLNFDAVSQGPRRGAQLKSRGGPKNFFFAILKGQNYLFLSTQRLHLSRKHAKSTTFWAKRAKLKASAGRMLRMPAVS